MDEKAEEEDLPRLPCGVCGRKFVPLSLEKHEKVCEKILMKKRKPFDSLKQRVEGTDMLLYHRKTYLKRTEPVAAPEKKKKRNWKEKHLELLTSIRAAKGISPDNKAMPYTKSPSLLADTKRCPSCDRQFGPKAYDRHVEWCKEKHAHQRLHHSPANVILAKERLEARLKYVPPLNRARKLPVKEKYSSQASPRTESTTSLVSQSSVRAKDKKTYLERNRVKIEAEKKKETKGTFNKPEEVKKNVPMMAISSPSLTSDSTKSKKNSMPSSKINSSTVNYELNGITVSSMKCNKTMVTWRDTLNSSRENSKEKMKDINESEPNLTSTKSENAVPKNSASKINKKFPIAKVKSKCTVQSKSEQFASCKPIKNPSVINLNFQSTTFEEPFEPLTATSEPDFKIEVDIRPNPNTPQDSNQEELIPPFTDKLNSESANKIVKSTPTNLKELPGNLQIKNPTTSDESVKALLDELEKGYQLDINLTDFSLEGIPSKFELDRISPHLDFNATRSRDTSTIELRKTFKTLSITDSCNTEEKLLNQGCEINTPATEKEKEVNDIASKLEIGSFLQNNSEPVSCNDDATVNSPETIETNEDECLQNFDFPNKNTVESNNQSIPSLSAEIHKNDISEDRNIEIRNSSTISVVKTSSNTEEMKNINGILRKTLTFIISNTNENNNQTGNVKPPEINPKRKESSQNKKVTNLKTPRSSRSINEKSSAQPSSLYNLNRSKTESLLLPPLYKSDQLLQSLSCKTNENPSSSSSNQTTHPSYELLPNKSRLNVSRSSSENTVLQKCDSKVSLTSWSNETLKDKSSVKIKQSLSSIDLDKVLLKNRSKNEGTVVSRFGSCRSLKPSTCRTSLSAQKRPHSEYVGDMKQYKALNSSSESSSRPALPKLSSVSTIYKAPYVTSSSVSSENSVYVRRTDDSSSSREDKQSMILLYNSKVENVESTDGKMIVSLDRFDVAKNCETDDSSSSERKFLSKISIPKNNSEETLMSVLFKSKESFDIDSMNSNKTSSESLPILKSVRDDEKIFQASLSSSENYSVPKKKLRLIDDDEETCNVDSIKLTTPKTKFSYKNPNRLISADHFLPKITSDKGDCSCNQTIHFVELKSSDLRLPKIGKEEKSVQVNFYEKISNRYDRVVVRSRYKLKSPGCESLAATDPYNIAQQQLMELLNCDDFRSITPLPHNTPHEDTIPLETKKELTPLQTLAITNTPMIKPVKDSLVEFELLESLIEKNLEESKSGYSSFNGKLPVDDTNLIDPFLINEDDNLAIPEDFHLVGDSPTYLDWHFAADIQNQEQMYLTLSEPNEQINMYNKTSTPKATKKALTITPVKANIKPSVKRALTVNNPKNRKPLTRSISSVSSEKSVCSEKEKPSMKKEPVKTTKSTKSKHLKQEETIDKWLQESNEKNSLEPSFKPEELFNVDDSMYEEFKKYEEMYLKERTEKSSSKKNKAKLIDLNYKIFTPGEEQVNANKLTIDSAYGSLTRSAPDHCAKPLTLPQLESNSVENAIMDEYVQSSSPSPTLPKNQLAKFCHECGNRYPVVTAKFCIECGVRRLIL